MSDDAQAIAPIEAQSPDSRQTAVAAGGLAGAVAAMSCCILPLALTLAGVGGAWLSGLRALAPYQPIFLALTAALLGYGFYLVYWKAGRACTGDAACWRTILPGRVVRGMLWLATVLAVATAAFPIWFPLILPYLP